MKHLFITLLSVLLSQAKPFTLPVEGLTQMFALKDNKGNANHLLTYSDGTQNWQVHALNKEEGLSTTLANKNIPDPLQKAVLYSGNIIVATGQSLKNRDAPIKVTLYPIDLSHPKTLLTIDSERAEVTSLRPLKDGILITYYDSKYFTQTSKLIEQDGVWISKKLFRIRMATSTDSDGKTYLVGRAYGDKIGVDGDAKLVSKGKEYTLPTFRGVSSLCLAQLDSDPELEVLTGDGWHQNYGKLAEPRVTMFDYNKEKDSYIATLLSNEPVPKQYRIEHLSVTNKGVILAQGPQQSYLFDPKQNWSKKVILTPSGTNATKVADLGDGYYSTYDGRLHIQHITF